MSIATRIGVQVGVDRHPRIRMWLQLLLIGAFLLSAAVHTTVEFRLPGLVGFLGLATVAALAYWVDGIPPSISSLSVWGVLLLGGFFCGTGLFLLFWTTWYAVLAGLLSIGLGLRYFAILADADGESPCR